MPNEPINNADWEKTEREMRDLLSGDPIPELTNFEARTMTQRILGRIGEKPALRWFDVRPAFAAGFAAAAVLLLVFGITQLKKPETQPQVEMVEIMDEYEEREPEEMLIDAIEDGEIEEKALSGLLALDVETAEEVYNVYAPADTDARIDMLTEEEAEIILKIMDELGYPDKEEA